ncbi:MAG TPA: MFS transporter [Opitutaceae bacterium]|jgi:MFS family permease|nr:MFS transporter [Opitutaceae bacterium]
MSHRNADRHVQSAEAIPYRRLWSACFLGFASIGMTMQIMPAYAHERLGANAVTAGLAVTIGSLGTMFSRPISGRLADESGGRRVAMAGAILALIGGVGHVLATNLPVLVLARLFLGAGEGALFTGSVGWILAHKEQSQRGEVAGHFGLSMWTGLAGGPMLGTAILTFSSYRSVWIAASVIPLAAWMLVASTRPEVRISSGVMNIRRALFPKAAWVPAASGISSSIGYGIIVAFLVPRFAALDFAGKNFALSVFGVAFIITRFLGSGYAHRFGARRVLLSAFLIESLGFAGLYLTHVQWLAFTSAALTGAGLSLLIPSVTSVVTEAANPRERTAALGAVTSAWDLGVAIGGPLGGFVAGPSIAEPFALGALAALIAIVPLAFISER